MSQEKIFHLKAMGAEIVLTRSDVGKGHPEYYEDMAERIARERGGLYMNQFANPANPLAHERTTAPEIWQQMEEKLDAVVVGVGSGGTLTGLGRYFSAHAPHVEMVLADPKGSILAPYVKTGTKVPAGSWLVEGIGEDFVPVNCELGFVSRAYQIDDAESIATSRALLKQEGIMCGSSSGTLMAAALRYCREQHEPKRVVTLVCDSGNKYLSKIFNDYWLDDQGLLARPETHDLRDLIARAHNRRNAIFIAPDDTLQAAYRKMKMYDVSQLPVMSEGALQGIIQETDILLSVLDDGEGFSKPVRSAMTSQLVTIAPEDPPQALLPIFAQGMTAIVMEGDDFLGLITPIDFLQYLRKRSGHP
jgi:cystathionine beta-synthase